MYSPKIRRDVLPALRATTSHMAREQENIGSSTSQARGEAHNSGMTIKDKDNGKPNEDCSVNPNNKRGFGGRAKE